MAEKVYHSCNMARVIRSFYKQTGDKVVLSDAVVRLLVQTITSAQGLFYK